MEIEVENFHDEGEDLIAEIRTVRHRISERFGHDPYKLVAYYMERQQEHSERLIRAPEEPQPGPSAE
ncbi:hypothetical protein [Longimicrobium sp.]|uniref:hypothetical protein n=1 Tax=Longimicrobium sp. TaxID=2029185 RepID=UPI002BB1AE17|nr:hypothetical protein [Longimicrobium sp.]HSU15278.1 hypothetical protein [Longimicrobium sp.]